MTYLCSPKSHNIDCMKKKILSLIGIILFVQTLSVLTACSDYSTHYEGARQEGGTLEQVNTGLPKVNIQTPEAQPITSKETWMEGAVVTIYNADGTVSYQGGTSVKGRGNSTWAYPKKPYALKLDKKSAILGMPKHKRWCLLANFIDRTMMRNDVSFEVARQMKALDYTPQGHFVELFLNGVHVGNYYLCEQIKVDENRVNIAELDENATSGLGITGGFIMEIDSHFDELFRFKSPYADLPWQCKDPDEVNEAQFEYIQNFVGEMESTLYDPVRFSNREFTKYMDLESFADWWIVYELTMNYETREPNSSFMHKDADTAEGVAKMKAGPVWDFDYGTFLLDYTHQFGTKYDLYYPRLFDDQEFRLLVKERWELAKQGGLLNHILEYIDRNEKLLEASDELNAPMWPVTGSDDVNKDTMLNFHDAVHRMKQAFTQKYIWLETAINNL